MSQAIMAYTLPNGTQVLIQPLENKGSEILPLVFLDDSQIEPQLLDTNATNVLLPGIHVVDSDLDTVMNPVCGLESSEEGSNSLATVMGTNNNLSTSVGHSVFEGDMDISADLSRVDIRRPVDVSVNGHNSHNSVHNQLTHSGKVCNDASEINNLRISTIPSEFGNLGNILVHNTSKTYADCDIVNAGKVVSSLETVLETSRQFDINTSASAGISNLSVKDELDSCDEEEEIVDDGKNEENNINVKHIKLNKGIETEMRLQSKFKTLHSNGLLPGTRVATESILEQACQSVALTLEDTDELKNDPMAVPSNNVILDHLDEFAEMVMWYKCRLCKFAAGDKDELLEHLRIDHLEGNVDNDALPKREDSGDSIIIPQIEDKVSEKLVFLCGQCSLGFGSLELCKAHMVKDHEMVMQENIQVNNVTTNASNLAAGPSVTGKRKAQLSHTLQKELLLDKKNVANSLTMKCPVRGCQTKFATQEQLQMHTSCHVLGDSRDFRCCECQIPFERWRTCAMHLWKTHNIDCGLLTCPICQKYKTATSVPLENHMRIHGEARLFTCHDCGKGFKQAAQLHNHRVMHLDRKTSELPKWYASKQCDICFKNYANSKCLKKHIQAVHSKLRPYVCQVCGHASARKAMLQLHYRQHTGEKPHSCPICDYRTGDHNSLRRHVMRHTGQRPYRCPHCPYSAIQSNSYKNHLRSKHPGQTGVYSCTQCSFKTVSHEGYELHMSDHKNGIISNSPDGSGSDVEVFPGNVAAAQLIYRCLNALSGDGAAVEANVTGSSTSADGTTQTITIQIPSQDCNNENDEDEVARCFLEVQQPEEEEEEGVDTGGITIPAESEQNMICHVAS